MLNLLKTLYFLGNTTINDQILYVSNSNILDTLYIPSGIYNVDNILMRSGCNIVGDGMDKTILKKTGGPFKYFISGKHINNISFTNISLISPDWRLSLLTDVNDVVIQNCKLEGGIVRFEYSNNIKIDSSVFNKNQGKAGYASHGCDNVNITNCRFYNPENGGINFSGHTNSIAKNNYMKSDNLVDSGYAGVRLPNSAMNNIVENNIIINYGRGLFVLTGSQNNILRNNTIDGTMYQGVFAQESNNIYNDIRIIDAGDEAFYIIGSNNIVDNIGISDTFIHDNVRYVGFQFGTGGNTISNSYVNGDYNRIYMNGNIEDNTLINNQYITHYIVPVPSNFVQCTTCVGNELYIRFKIHPNLLDGHHVFVSMRNINGEGIVIGNLFSLELNDGHFKVRHSTVGSNYGIGWYEGFILITKGKWTVSIFNGNGHSRLYKTETFPTSHTTYLGGGINPENVGFNLEMEQYKHI